MNLKTLSKRFKWRYARLAIALIGILALLLICLTACKSSQKASESHCHRQQTLSSSDSSRTVDLTVIHDTISVIKTETLWREPDSLGKIYPLITINEERTAKHQTDKNIVRIRADTIHITDNTDHIATTTAKSSAGCSLPQGRDIRFSAGFPGCCWLAWWLSFHAEPCIISRRIRRIRRERNFHNSAYSAYSA